MKMPTITITCEGCGEQLEAVVETVDRKASAKPCKCMAKAILGSAREIMSAWPHFHIGMSEIVDMMRCMISKNMFGLRMVIWNILSTIQTGYDSRGSTIFIMPGLDIKIGKEFIMSNVGSSLRPVLLNWRVKTTSKE